MRIFHTHFGRDGGAERFFVNLSNALAREGVAQTALIRPGRDWRSRLPASMEVHEGLPRTLSISRILLPLKFRRLLKAQQPDGILAWMPRAANFMPAWPGCPRVARLGDYPTRLGEFRNIQTLVCNTPGIADHVRKLGWKGGVEVISNFTAVKASPPVDRSAMGAPAGAFTVVAGGRFVRRKGFHVLIDAMALLPGAHLCLLGDGEERDALLHQVRKLGIADRVHFVGWKADVAPWLAAGDVYCMPSLHEPLGNVILEAWGAGKPVVSSRSEGPTWMMRDGEDGLLYDIEDAAGLAAALRRLRDDPALRAKVAAGGVRTLEERFSERAITRAYIRLFAERAAG